MTNPKNKLQNLLNPTIPSEFVFDALQAYSFKGYNRDALLAEFEIESSHLNAPGLRISVADYSALIDKIITELDDGFLGFLDNKIPKMAFSVFASQLAACENLYQLLTQANHFYGLFTKQFRLVVEEGGSDAIIKLEFDETQEFDYRFIYQSILLVLTRLMHWFIGQNIQPKRVCFSFNGEHLDKYLHYLFDCQLEYLQPLNEIHIEKSVLFTPCSTNLLQVQEMLRDSTRMMLVSHKPAPYTACVRKELVLNQQDNWLNIEDVAHAIGMSKNLLWRKLKKENTSFLTIRDELKRDYSLSLITNYDLNIGDIAAKVGFADVSSFNKAFYKWTGLSPSAYRKAYKAF